MSTAWASTSAAGGGLSAGQYTCKRCKAEFADMGFLRRHTSSGVACYFRDDKYGKYHCPRCPAQFTRPATVTAHVRRAHWSAPSAPSSSAIEDDEYGGEYGGGQAGRSTRRRQVVGGVRRVFPCEACAHVSPTPGDAREHRREHFVAGMAAGAWGSGANAHFTAVKSAHKGIVASYRYVLPSRIHFLDAALAHVSPLLASFLRERLAAGGGFLRAACTLSVEMVKISKEAVIEDMISIHLAAPMANVTAHNVSEVLLEWFDEIDAKLDAFVHNGSGWTLSDVEFIDCLVVRAPPLKGACSLHKLVYDASASAAASAADADAAAGPSGGAGKSASSKATARARFARDPATGELAGFPAPRRANSSDVEVVNVNLSDGQRNDPRFADCFFLAVARALVGPDGDGRPWLLHDCIAASFSAFDYAGRGGGDMTMRDIDRFEDTVGEELDLAIHVLYQNEEGDIFPLRASPRAHRYALARGEEEDAAVVGGLPASTAPMMPQSGPSSEETAPQPPPPPTSIVLMLSYFALPAEDAPQAAAAAAAGTADAASSSSTALMGGRDTGAPSHTGHYALIEEPEKLLAPRVVDERGKVVHRQGGKVCLNCFTFLHRRSTYDRHVRWCFAKGGQAVRMPRAGETARFANQRHETLSAFAIYFDFETYGCAPPEGRGGCACSAEAVARADRLRGLRGAEMKDSEGRLRERDASEEACLVADGAVSRRELAPVCPHKTRVVNEQRAYAYSMLVVDRTGRVEREVTYAGDDAVEHFLNSLLDAEEALLERLKGENAAPMNLSEERRSHLWREARDSFYASGGLPAPASADIAPHQCHICRQVMRPADMVFDHDHLTGEFIGLAHNVCNLHRVEPARIPVLAHNFSAFDGHLLMKEMEKVWPRVQRIQAIALNTQKFKCIFLNKMVLMDSTAFLDASLNTLTDTLAKSGHEFGILKQWRGLRRLRGGEIDDGATDGGGFEAEVGDGEKEERFAALQRKGVFPYDWVTDGRPCLEAAAELPPREAFFNVLTQEGVGEEDYAHALHVWSAFRCRSMLDYSMVYVQSDVYLLAECVAQMRQVVWEAFSLDMLAYLSFPMLSKDLMLKTSGAEMELMSDYDMVMTVQRGIRGGLAFVNNRLVELEATKLLGHYKKGFEESGGGGGGEREKGPPGGRPRPPRFITHLPAAKTTLAAGEDDGDDHEEDDDGGDDERGDSGKCGGNVRSGGGGGDIGGVWSILGVEEDGQGENVARPDGDSDAAGGRARERLRSPPRRRRRHRHRSRTPARWTPEGNNDDDDGGDDDDDDGGRKVKMPPCPVRQAADEFRREILRSAGRGRRRYASVDASAEREARDARDGARRRLLSAVETLVANRKAQKKKRERQAAACAGVRPPTTCACHSLCGREARRLGTRRRPCGCRVVGPGCDHGAGAGASGPPTTSPLAAEGGSGECGRDGRLGRAEGKRRRRTGPARRTPACMAYVDCNNLYGCAMTYPMPLDGFRWLTAEEIERFDVARDVTAEDDAQGYLLEVDLEYPRSLHISHNSFPLAPEQRTITEEHLSPFAAEAAETLRASASSRSKKRRRDGGRADSAAGEVGAEARAARPRYRSRKLTSTFEKRVRYLVHGLNLKFYLEQGLRLTKIHRVIAFRQRAFMREYINMCTRKRKEAPSKAVANVWKKAVNSLYGKMIESNENRMDCRFNFDDEGAFRRYKCPSMKAAVVCSENLSVSFHRKKEAFMNQSWAVGFAVLEISKLIMQRLFYETIRPAFGGRASVLMSDTDSFVLLLPESHVETALGRLDEVMDWSNYPPDHPAHDDSRKNELGLLKNEVPSFHPIEKFCGVRAKSYTYVTCEDASAESRAKGIKTSFKGRLRWEDYKEVIEGVASVSMTQFGIQAKDHVNRIVRTERVAFTSFDDKRFLLCPRHSVPYGSFLAETAPDDWRESCYFCERDYMFV